MFWDDNSISIDGPTELAVSDDQVMRFHAHGWAAERVDGHDTDAVAEAIRRAHKSDRPNLIACGYAIRRRNWRSESAWSRIELGTAKAGIMTAG